MKNRVLVTVALLLGIASIHVSMFAAIRVFAQQPAPDPSNYRGNNTLLPADDLQTGRRRFVAEAHSAWHIHPGGQLLHVEDGVGVVQRRGEDVTVLRIVRIRGLRSAAASVVPG